MTESKRPFLHPSGAALSALVPRLYALVPCAGTGTRAGAAGPKQYQMLAGKPLVLHTLSAFADVARIDRTLVVVAPDDEVLANLETPSKRCWIAACGGSTRAESVFNGLNWLVEEGAAAHDWVLVHDAARCLIRPDQINSLIDACLHDEVGGLLALPLPDTLKQAQGKRVQVTLQRQDKWLAQTPQMFRIGSLLEALQLAGDRVTDESSAIEALGLAPLLVPGSAQNFKVTYPEDFALAESLLQSRHKGNG